MAVDLKALAKIAEGEPSSKVTVTRRWLTEVHRLLSEAEKVKFASKPRDTRAWLDDMLGGLK